MDDDFDAPEPGKPVRVYMRAQLLPEGLIGAQCPVCRSLNAKDVHTCEHFGGIGLVHGLGAAFKFYQEPSGWKN
jgi:hypothetical protein